MHFFQALVNGLEDLCKDSFQPDVFGQLYTRVLSPADKGAAGAWVFPESPSGPSAAVASTIEALWDAWNPLLAVFKNQCKKGVSKLVDEMNADKDFVVFQHVYRRF